MERETREQIKEWVRMSFKAGYSLKELKEKTKKFPRDAKLIIEKEYKTLQRADKKSMRKIGNKLKRIDKLKGGFDKMPKDTEQYDDDFDFGDDEEEEEEEDYEVEEKPKPKPKKKVVKKIARKDYLLQHSPERIMLVDPVKKQVLIEGSNVNDLTLQLLMKIYQKVEESL